MNAQDIQAIRHETRGGEILRLLLLSIVGISVGTSTDNPFVR